MLKSIYIIILFCLFYSCKLEEDKNDTQKKESTHTKKKPKIESSIKSYRNQEKVDNILEDNNPNNIDLSRHQLFRDTTRNSEFYQKYLNWKPNQLDNDAISHHINEISKRYKPKKFDIKNFRKQWITLKKLNNEFVIYYPCDGNTTSFELTESAVLFYYQLEPDADLIYNLKSLTDSNIELELRTVGQKIKSEKTELSIEPTEWENIYLLTYSFGKWYVTPKDKITKFDLIVNHCPVSKVSEYKGFDE